MPGITFVTAMLAAPRTPHRTLAGMPSFSPNVNARVAIAGSGIVHDNRSMRVIAGLLIAAALGLAQDWKTATDLPGVSWEGLSADQKLAALTAMRAFDCTCGCSMKVAQCRIEDPPCGHSKALAAMALDAAKRGKSEPEILKILQASDNRE